MTVLRTLVDLIKRDENVSPNTYVLATNGVNRIYLGEQGLPPAGAYRDVVAQGGAQVLPAAGDIWIYVGTPTASGRRIYICTVGGATPTWEPISNLHRQIIAFASTITPDLSLGTSTLVTLTGNITVNLPTNSDPGMFWAATFIQDATGGRQVAWPSTIPTAWQPAQAANAVSTILLVRGATNIWAPLAWNPGPFITNNATPVTITNPTAAGNLMSIAWNAGGLNGLGRGFRIKAYGTITVVGSTTTMTISVKLGSLVLCTITTGAISILSNVPWEFEAEAIVTTTGASGALEVHGRLTVPLTTAAGAASVYLDQNTAPVSTVDLTAIELLQMQGQIGTGNAATTITERMQTVEALTVP